MSRETKKQKTLEKLLEEFLVIKEEQPYSVPQNWVWTKITPLINLERGITFPALAKNTVYKDGLIGCARTANIQEIFDWDDMIYVDKKYMKDNQAKLIKENDILMSVANSHNLVGKVSYIERLNEEITFGGFLMCIRSKYLDSRFLFFYYIEIFLSGKIRKLASQTTNIANISGKKLEAMKLPLPPIGEQRRISKKVEYLLGKIDEAKQLIDEAKETSTLRQASFLDKAFRGELTEIWRINKIDDLRYGSKQHYSEVNDKVPYNLPEGWNWFTINDIAKVKGGKRLPKGESLVKEDTGYPYIKAGNLKEGTVISEQLEFLLPETQEKIKKYTVSAGDVYITIVGARIGDCGIIPKYLEGANLTENAAKIFDLKNCNNKYLSYWLSSPQGQTIIKSKISSAAQGKLALSRIKTILIPLPPIEEQEEIIVRVEKFLSKEKEAEKIIPDSNELDKLKQTILSKAFRGELRTNDPTEESAIELLKLALEERVK